MTTLWIEPFGGVAGDMLLAALLDLDDPRFRLADLRALAQELVPGEAELGLEVVQRRSLRAQCLTVLTPESSNPPHRHLADLERILERSSLPERARRRASAALAALADAEGRVHGVDPNKVHFHEVGAVDTLIDVGGVALALERLDVERVYSDAPLLGSGTLHCAHGELPVPPPAVAELLRGRPAIPGGGGERTTPTGAALLTTLTEEFGPPPRFAAQSLGYGAGVRDPETGPPNLLRVQLGTEASQPRSRVEAWLLEVNLDDMSPEEVGHAVGALRAAGALEVWTTAAQMKKDRPGAVVSALTRESGRRALERVVFELTTTLGVRWTRLERSECERREISVEVEGHAVRVKIRTRVPGPDVAPAGERDVSPEHDDLVAAAQAAGLTLREARRLAIEAAMNALLG